MPIFNLTGMMPLRSPHSLALIKSPILPLTQVPDTSPFIQYSGAGWNCNTVDLSFTSYVNQTFHATYNLVRGG
jgi:hypothetical protein